MTRKLSLIAFLVLAACLVLAAIPAGAEVCRFDNQPGATLLLPYFEVDLADPQGLTTIFSVNNISSETVLARVVLWTDAAYPTLGFELYLRGFDVQSLDVRDLLSGRLPVTGPEGPGDLVFPTCPAPAPAQPPTGAFLRAAHTGRAVAQLEGQCAGFDHGDEVARGYVTVDVVGGCTTLMPSDAGYFGDGGVAAHRNVLWGDYFYLDTAAGNARGATLVALESDPERFGPGDATFYQRYVGQSGADGREPLPTLWANRFQGGGGIVSSSIVWRDTGARPATFPCGKTPDFYPLGHMEVVNFDEHGDEIFWSTDIATFAPLPPLFPLAAQRGEGRRAFAFGWERVDLNPSPEERRQSHLVEVLEARGVFSLVRTAVPLDDGCSVAGCVWEDGATPAAGRLCLGGPGFGVRTLMPGEPIPVQVFPAGCFSSSCTQRYRTLCEVSRPSPGELEVGANFCLRVLAEGEGCTEDCGGGGTARCGFGAGLPAGDYTLRAGELAVSFSVPMMLPAEGLCVQAPGMP